MKKVVLLFSFLLIFNSCGNDGEKNTNAETMKTEKISEFKNNNEEKEDTSPLSEEKEEIQLDSLGTIAAGEGYGSGVGRMSRGPASGGTEDTSVTPVTPTNAELPKRGNIAFYIPNKMLENTATNISVIISKDSLEKVKQRLETVLMEVEAAKSQKQLRENIRAHAITVYSKMKVELNCSDADFEILSKPASEFMLFDSTTVEKEWDWVIKPKKTGKLQLILIVWAYQEKSQEWIPVESPPHIFNVTVQVDPRSYFSKLWSFFETNPEWLFVQILFPLIAYFAGRKKGKSKK